MRTARGFGICWRNGSVSPSGSANIIYGELTDEELIAEILEGEAEEGEAA